MDNITFLLYHSFTLVFNYFNMIFKPFYYSQSVKIIKNTHEKLMKFYESGDNTDLKQWIYKTSIDGIDL